MTAPAGGVAIAGIGATEFSKKAGRSELQLATSHYGCLGRCGVDPR